MAGEQGFEPWNAGIKIQCLNQLGDSPTQLVVRTAAALWAAFINAGQNEFGHDSINCDIGCWLMPLAFQVRHAPLSAATA